MFCSGSCQILKEVFPDGNVYLFLCLGYVNVQVKILMKSRLAHERNGDPTVGRFCVLVWYTYCIILYIYTFIYINKTSFN